MALCPVSRQVGVTTVMSSGPVKQVSCTKRAVWTTKVPFTSAFLLDKGVPWGSYSGPFLFTEYANLVFNVTKLANKKAPCYTDDHQVYDGFHPEDILMIRIPHFGNLLCVLYRKLVDMMSQTFLSTAENLVFHLQGSSNCINFPN